MGKLKKLFYLFIMILFFFNTNLVNAAKDYQGKFVIIDGNKVSYDENAINGKVDIPNQDEKTRADNYKVELEEKYLSVPLLLKNTYYVNTINMVLNALDREVDDNNLVKDIKESYNIFEIKDILNKRAEGTKFKFSSDYITDINTFKMNTTSAIAYGNPVIVSLSENVGDVYFRNHSTTTDVETFGVISGYTEYGDKVLYLESGHGRFANFSKPQIVKIDDLYFATEGGLYVW